MQRTLLGLLPFFVYLPLLSAQDPTGMLEGQVTDPSGALVRDAQIEVRNSANGFIARQRSQENGNFRFSYLGVGEYRLHVAAP